MPGGSHEEASVPGQRSCRHVGHRRLRGPAQGEGGRHPHHDRWEDGGHGELEEELHESVRLLKTGHVDLWQIHGVPTLDEIDKILAPGGAMEAFEARRRPASAASSVHGQEYAKLPPELADVRCRDCERCTANCPYGVQVSTRLGRAQELFA